MTEQQTLIPLSSGADLRHLRMSRGLSLDEVSAGIRCPRGVLEAIEADQTPDLAPIYVKGHLRRYADYLGLDEDQTLALLALHDGDAPEVRTVFEHRPPAQASDRWIRVASYALGSLLVGTLAWQMTHEAVRLTRVERPATPDAAEAEPVSPGKHVNASMGLESLHGPSGSRTADAGAQAWKALEEARRARQALAEGQHLLEVETSADTWVEIFGAEGETMEQDLLRGGERRSYRGAGPFQVSLGRSSAVRLSLDGEAVDLAPFTRDDVARLLLDPADFAAPGSGAIPE